MPAYHVEIEHRETDQVFSYYHGDGMLHFNASLLARLHTAMPREFRRITMDIEQENYELCMQHRGIDEAKVEALTPNNLREPGYGVMFDDGLFTIIDGHHRLVRRYRGGLRVMDFWVTHQEVWDHCLVHYTDEGERALAAGMPPRAENPEPLAMAVALHPPETKR